jgi:hypothetical protein
MQWQKHEDFPNEILEISENFYISYNPNPAAGSEIVAAIDLVLGDTRGSEETAILTNRKYYILIGNWKDQYALAAQEDEDACVALYLANARTHKSDYSDTHPMELN